MKIAINCWVLRNKQLDGIGYFTKNVVAKMIENNPQARFQILCDKKFTENYFDFPNADKYKIFPPFRHPLLYVFYLEFIVPIFLRKHKPDIFVSADGFLSLLSGCKQLPIIYDINFEHYPKDLKIQNRIYFRFFFKKFVRKAKRIATISEYSKQDIVKHYGIGLSKIDNVSCGINGNFNPLSKSVIDTVREQWSNGKPYFFFVGSMHPRKNIHRLITAFNYFKKATGSDFKLLLAGSILWKKSELESAYITSAYRDDIIFTGRLSDDQLQHVLGAAFALSFVPIFEGFGLPIVEAMQSGVPVICSNVTSMPEVAGDAAVFVDPFDVQSIANGMETLYNNSGYRQDLIQKGNKQKELFSWDRTSLLLWDCVDKAINNIDEN